MYCVLVVIVLCRACAAVAVELDERGSLSRIDKTKTFSEQLVEAEQLLATDHTYADGVKLLEHAVSAGVAYKMLGSENQTALFSRTASDRVNQWRSQWKQSQHGPSELLRVDENRFVFATFLASDDYIPGVIALAQSLRAVHTRYQLVCLVTEGPVSESSIIILRLLLIDVLLVPEIPAPTHVTMSGDKASRYARTFAKLHVFGLQQYFEKVVYLDADMLLLRNIDELMLMPAFAACMGEGVLYLVKDTTKHFFNSGMMVVIPSPITLAGMLQLLYTPAPRASDGGGTNSNSQRRHVEAWDTGGDQDVINAFYAFPQAHILPMQYNVFPDLLASIPWAFSSSEGNGGPALNRADDVLDGVKAVQLYWIFNPWQGKRTKEASFPRRAGYIQANPAAFELMYGKWRSMFMQGVALLRRRQGGDPVQLLSIVAQVVAAGSTGGGRKARAMKPKGKGFYAGFAMKFYTDTTSMRKKEARRRDDTM
jgi:hypothetical protein